jgi:hypothetical protein
MAMAKTALAEAALSSDRTAVLAAFLDELIPGDAVHWPAFSVAVPVAAFAARFGADESASLLAAAECAGRATTKDRAAAIAAWGRSEPDAFAAVLGAAHRAYYTAPPVLAAVAVLADAAPRETSPLFDLDLIAQVAATGAGRRRL